MPQARLLRCYSYPLCDSQQKQTDRSYFVSTISASINSSKMDKRTYQNWHRANGCTSSRAFLLLCLLQRQPQAWVLQHAPSDSHWPCRVPHGWCMLLYRWKLLCTQLLGMPCARLRQRVQAVAGSKRQHSCCARTPSREQHPALLALYICAFESNGRRLLRFWEPRGNLRSHGSSAPYSWRSWLSCLHRPAGRPARTMQGPTGPFHHAIAQLRAQAAPDAEKLQVLERMASNRDAGPSPRSTCSTQLTPTEVRWARQLHAQRQGLFLLSRHMPLPPALLEAVGSSECQSREAFRAQQVLFVTVPQVLKAPRSSTGHGVY